MILFEELCGKLTNQSAASDNYQKLPAEANSHTKSQSSKVLATTTALCMHSVVLGLVLASTLYMGTYGENKSLGVIIMLALLIHKVPEAVGYGQFLIESQCS